MPRTCGGRCWRRIAYREESRELTRPFETPPGCKKKATYRMRVSDTERPDEPSDEQRVSPRRVLLWGLIAVAILVGVYLYFRYERVLAPLVSS
jgi:hypothetical protein